MRRRISNSFFGRFSPF
uniref:Uncharacterized protein n=1 Tax=Rhizophora mucronata TaxID=61149 RepID=A0A2P2PM82_RHIMU